MRKLKMKDLTVFIDNEDYDLIAHHKWTVRYGWGNTPYAIGRINGKYIPMHRLLMNPPKEMLVDHKNHNTLDNRRKNLRICTRSQNMWNRKKSCGTSKYKGVHWCSYKNRWRADIYIYNKCIKLGRFDSEDDAAKAYNKKAKELFGEFACLNKIKRKKS